MNRASAILKNAREDKCFDISEVCKKLKISQNYIKAIEEENISQFPSEPYCSLIVKDYAVFLGLGGDDILSLFRRDFATPLKPNSAHLGTFSLTPQFIFKWSVIIAVFLFSSYIIVEYLKYNRPPNLKVNWPEDSSLIVDSVIEISGTTDAEATVRINKDLIIVNSDGNFHKSINVPKTELKLTVESTSHSGKTTTVEKLYRPK